MIPLQDQALLRVRFAQDVKNRVRLDFFGQRPSPIIIPGRPECPFCEDVRTLVREVGSLSPRIALTEHEFSESARVAAELGVDKIPAIVLRGPTNRPVRYFGMPTGAEFPSFIETLMETASGIITLDAATQRTLKKIRNEVKLQVFVMPSCTHSPAVARAAFRFALSNVKIKTDVVEAPEFPHLVQKYQLEATPSVVIDEKLVLPGAMDEATFADCILRLVEGKQMSDDLKLGPGTAISPPQQQETRTGPGGLIIPR